MLSYLISLRKKGAYEYIVLFNAFRHTYGKTQLIAHFKSFNISNYGFCPGERIFFFSFLLSHPVQVILCHQCSPVLSFSSHLHMPILAHFNIWLLY